MLSVRFRWLRTIALPATLLAAASLALGEEAPSAPGRVVSAR